MFHYVYIFNMMKKKQQSKFVLLLLQVLRFLKSLCLLIGVFNLELNNHSF